MKLHSILIFLTLGLGVLTTGCSHDLDEDTSRALAAQAPINLDREQVSLTDAQVTCGVSNDLWEPAPSDGGNRMIYHLTPGGRDLQFSDDIYANDPDYATPYSQVRGKFSLDMGPVAAIRDGSDGGTKLIQAPFGVKIPHTCFPDSLPIMGVNKGKFIAGLAPTLIFENSDKGWLPTKLIH